MQMNITPADGAGASLSRRTFLAVAAAGTAAAFPALATPQADSETNLLHSPVDHELDACVALLKSILMQMHPEASEVGSTNTGMISNPDGSFFMVLSGRVPSKPFDGDGHYILSMDGYPQLFHLAHRHTYGRSTGNILPGQDYYSATAIHNDGYVGQPRRMVSPRILRKVEGGREL